jgi:FAD binding domain
MTDPTTEEASQLAARTAGRVWSAAAGDQAGYDEERSGFNLALDHRPSLILGAVSAADVAAGIRFAADHNLPVDLQATGHGAHRAMQGGLLITTGHMSSVIVDPERRRARVSAGTTSGEVIAASTASGLAAPVGGAPGVGYVSYTLGGGLSPLGRSCGYAADFVRSLDVVTADGRELTVTPDQHQDLFWALRGGGGNLAAVTSIEIDLLPYSEVYGGGLYFDGERAAEVLGAFGQSIVAAPPELCLSVAFVSFPDLPVLPPPLRGKFCCHVRVVYLGTKPDGDGLIARLRAVAPFLDTVDVLPLAQVGTVHGDPVGPMPVNTNSLALRSDDALHDLISHIRPDAPFMLEVRHLAGALGGPTTIPTAVGHRAAVLNVFTSAYPGTPPAAAADAQQRVFDAIGSSGVGGPLRNFLPSHYPDAVSCYEPATADELAKLEAIWDPAHMFRFTPSLKNPSPR